MLPVEITTLPGNMLVLRARGSEIYILPDHVKKLKDISNSKEFVGYFMAQALLNRPARKLFEAWLRKDNSLWQRMFATIRDWELEADENTEETSSDDEVLVEQGKDSQDTQTAESSMKEYIRVEQKSLKKEASSSSDDSSSKKKSSKSSEATVKSKYKKNDVVNDALDDIEDSLDYEDEEEDGDDLEPVSKVKKVQTKVASAAKAPTNKVATKAKQTPVKKEVKVVAKKTEPKKAVKKVVATPAKKKTVTTVKKKTATTANKKKG